MTNNHTIPELTALATQHGWTPVSGATSIRYIRDSEHLTVNIWPDGNISSAHGWVAAGIVATRELRHSLSGHPIDTTAIAEALRGQRASDYPNNSGYVLRVTEGTHTPYAPCPADDVTHRLIPGDYPIELFNLNGSRTTAERAYDAVARVPTDRGSIQWSVYAYTLPNGAHPATRATLSGHGQILELASQK